MTDEKLNILDTLSIYGVAHIDLCNKHHVCLGNMFIFPMLPLDNLLLLSRLDLSLILG